MAKQIDNNQETKKNDNSQTDRNNSNKVKNAANVANKSGFVPAEIAGKAINTIDNLSDGKLSNALGKGLSKLNDRMPGGNFGKNILNNFNNHNPLSKIGRAPTQKNQVARDGQSDANRSVSPTEGQDNKNSNATKGEQNKNNQGNQSRNNNGESGENKDHQQGGTSSSDEKRNSDDTKKKKNGNDLFSFIGKKKIIFWGLIIFVGVFVFFLIIVVITSIFSQYDSFSDGFGVSGETSAISGEKIYSGSEEQKRFYDKINNIKLSYQSNGKTVDPVKVIAAFYVIKLYGANISYDSFSDSEIRKIMDAMFDENKNYSDDTFKNNLVNNVFPSYFPNSSEEEREKMAEQVFTYIDYYNKLLETNTAGSDSSCASSGTCTYAIKGYYIQGKGNVSESVNTSNLYVRLMQCGSGYGGTYGQPLEGEELVPFEKYILGVAYQEIGPTSPKEAIKAQMVAARSYILARHADMGGWRTLKEEGDKWVLQVASCTLDQVYCDPDKGCSGSSGQSGQVHSGTGHGSFQRSPLAQDSPFRTYASETAGEVLVNSQGYIIYSGFTSVDQNQFIRLANSGLDYKQILLQVYNQGSRNYGASTIQKMNCGGASCTQAASGDYANWKQYEGPWINISVGGGGTIKTIGCLATSVAIQIARSGVPTNVSDFNPGTFVEYMNSHGGFTGGGLFTWSAVSSVAPTFKYAGREQVSGSNGQKISRLKEIINQPNTYAVVEVTSSLGQHWVAIDRVENDNVYMMDPGSTKTDLIAQYRTFHTIAYFKVTS